MVRICSLEYQSDMAKGMCDISPCLRSCTTQHYLLLYSCPKRFKLFILNFPIILPRLKNRFWSLESRRNFDTFKSLDSSDEFVGTNLFAVKNLYCWFFRHSFYIFLHKIFSHGSIWKKKLFFFLFNVIHKLYITSTIFIRHGRLFPHDI